MTSTKTLSAIMLVIALMSALVQAGPVRKALSDPKSALKDATTDGPTASEGLTDNGNGGAVDLPTPTLPEEPTLPEFPLSTPTTLFPDWNNTHPPIFPNCTSPDFNCTKNITIDIIIIKPESKDNGGDKEEKKKVPACEGAINSTCCTSYNVSVYAVESVDKHTGEVYTDYFSAPDQYCTYEQVTVVKPKCDVEFDHWCFPSCSHCSSEEKVETKSVELELLADQKFPPAVWKGEDDFLCFCSPAPASVVVSTKD